MSQAKHDPQAAQAEPKRKVGYCQPPEERRFKKGVSGNPNGRPRKKSADADGSLSELSKLVEKRANRRVTITENGKTQKVKVPEVIFRQIELAALKGDLKAARLYFDALENFLQRERRERQRGVTKLAEYKQRLAKEIHHAELNLMEPFSPLPHPDDILIDTKKGEVIINGPVDDVEKAQWDLSEIERSETLDDLESLKEELANPDEQIKNRTGFTREDLVSMYADNVESLATLDAFYPVAAVRRQPGFNLEQWRREKGKGKTRPEWN